MIRLRRLLKILRVVYRYRLDTLVSSTSNPPAGKDTLPLSVRLILAPAYLYGSPKASRGERLRKALETLGPIFVKFGQLLSTRPDLVPADICEELAYLQDNVAPFKREKFQQIVEQALGCQR